MTTQRNMVCPNPNCGYRGPAASKPKGSRVVLVILMALLILPGLIYGMLCSGRTYYCPECGTVVDLA